jgi:hypothetical protein
MKTSQGLPDCIILVVKTPARRYRARLAWRRRPGRPPSASCAQEALLKLKGKFCEKQEAAIQYYNAPQQHVHGACLCPCCMPMSILHADVNAECPCPCYMPMFMLHAYVSAAFPCTCCMSMSITYVHAHAACPCSCCMPVLMLHAYAHASCQCYLSIDCTVALLTAKTPAFCKEDINSATHNNCLADGQDHGDDGHPPKGHCGQGLQAIQVLD